MLFILTSEADICKHTGAVITWHGAPVNAFLADYDTQCAEDSLPYPPDPSFSPLYSALCVGGLYVDYTPLPSGFSQQEQLVGNWRVRKENYYGIYSPSFRFALLQCYSGHIPLTRATLLPNGPLPMPTALTEIQD